MLKEDLVGPAFRGGLFGAPNGFMGGPSAITKASSGHFQVAQLNINIKSTHHPSAAQPERPKNHPSGKEKDRINY
jgi:hypothetical protein